MTKWLLLVVLGFGVWSHYQRDLNLTSLDRKIQPMLEERSVANEDESIADNVAGFECDSRQYCSQMRSRAEAEYFVRNCPNNKMDGDHDGIPCENDSRF